MALIPIAYAAFEIGLSALDAYSTGSTFFDPCASGKEKALSASLFIIGALAPGGGYSTAGKIGAKFSQSQIMQFEKNLAQYGKSSLSKSLRSLEKRLTEQYEKIEAAKRAGGFTSSMEKEVKNFKQQIEAIKEILRRAQ